MNSPARRQLTPEDLRASQNLRRLWEAFAAKHNLTQADAAHGLGTTTGAISQYLNAKTPLGLAAVYRWAAYLDCDPYEIRPDLDDLLGVIGPRGQQRYRVDDRLLAQAIQEVEDVLTTLRVDLSTEEKGRLAAIVYTDAIKRGGQINREIIRGIAQFAS